MTVRLSGLKPPFSKMSLAKCPEQKGHVRDWFLSVIYQISESTKLTGSEDQVEWSGGHIF